MTLKREAVYDLEISPLMARIIAVCKEHDIPHVASFQLDDERPDNDSYCCTSARVPDDACGRLKQAYAAIYPPPEMYAFTITSRARSDDE